MKKAAVITECRRYRFNFGETLQAVALNKVISNMGIDCFTVSYEHQSKDFKGWFIHNIRRYAVRGIKFEIFRRKYIKNNIIRSNSKDKIECFVKKCDVLICGSDCIWYEKDYNEIFFLYFPSITIPKISYAPSLRDRVICDNTYYIKVRKWIQGINYVSTREKAGSDIIESILHKQVETVLDPTLLFDNNTWSIMAAKRMISEPYVLCYLLGKTKRFRYILNQIKKQYNNRKIIWIAMENNDGYIFGKELYNIGPSEFISLIKYADAVVTDSFHGTAFSLIFNKQLYTLKRIVNRNDVYNNDSRIINILDILKIKNYYEAYDNINFKQAQIDYKYVNKRLLEERKKSLKFLKSALKNEGLLN